MTCRANQYKVGARAYSLSQDDENFRDEHWHIGGCPHRVWLKSVERLKNDGRFMLKNRPILGKFGYCSSETTTTRAPKISGMDTGIQRDVHTEFGRNRPKHKLIVVDLYRKTVQFWTKNGYYATGGNYSSFFSHISPFLSIVGCR